MSRSAGRRPGDPAGWAAFAVLVVCLVAGWPVLSRHFHEPAAPVLVVVPMGAPSAGVMDHLCGQLGREHTVRRLDGLPPPNAAWVDARRQYDAATFLKSLESIPLAPGEKLLAVANVHAGTPELTIVFGLAEQSGRRAAIFTSRLTDGASERQWEHRVLTTARHEIGHLAGLRHCGNSACAMHYSHSLADTDAKGPGFCEYCQRAWDAARG